MAANFDPKTVNTNDWLHVEGVKQIDPKAPKWKSDKTRNNNIKLIQEYLKHEKARLAEQEKKKQLEEEKKKKEAELDEKLASVPAWKRPMVKAKLLKQLESGGNAELSSTESTASTTPTSPPATSPTSGGKPSLIPKWRQDQLAKKNGESEVDPKSSERPLSFASKPEPKINTQSKEEPKPNAEPEKPPREEEKAAASASVTQSPPDQEPVPVVEQTPSVDEQAPAPVEEKEISPAVVPPQSPLETQLPPEDQEPVPVVEQTPAADEQAPASVEEKEEPHPITDAAVVEPQETPSGSKLQEPQPDPVTITEQQPDVESSVTQEKTAEPEEQPVDQEAEAPDQNSVQYTESIETKPEQLVETENSTEDTTTNLAMQSDNIDSSHPAESAKSTEQGPAVEPPASDLTQECVVDSKTEDSDQTTDDRVPEQQENQSVQSKEEPKDETVQELASQTDSGLPDVTPQVEESGNLQCEACRLRMARVFDDKSTQTDSSVCSESVDQIDSSETQTTDSGAAASEDPPSQSQQPEPAIEEIQPDQLVEKEPTPQQPSCEGADEPQSQTDNSVDDSQQLGTEPVIAKDQIDSPPKCPVSEDEPEGQEQPVQQPSSTTVQADVNEASEPTDEILETQKTVEEQSTIDNVTMSDEPAVCTDSAPIESAAVEEIPVSSEGKSQEHTQVVDGPSAVEQSETGAQAEEPEPSSQDATEKSGESVETQGSTQEQANMQVAVPPSKEVVIVPNTEDSSSQ